MPKPLLEQIIEEIPEGEDMIRECVRDKKLISLRGLLESKMHVLMDPEDVLKDLYEGGLEAVMKRCQKAFRIKNFMLRIENESLQ